MEAGHALYRLDDFALLFTDLRDVLGSPRAPN
jgi:hypothetical protein